MAKKLYYKIGEACKILAIQPYVLRYWETEFPFLSPSKSKSGQRVYSEAELDVIRRIKELLYDEGYTIAGAKKKLEAELEEAGGAPPARASRAQSGGKSGSKAAPKAAAAPPATLDSGAAKQIENLRSGIEDALRQAQGILDLFGAPAR